MPNSADSADEDGEEEEEEEEFYESLDRILSSSSSSTSTSDDDGGGGGAVRRCPRFPPASAASFEVWISEPTSIEERRLRLLRQMGLAGDPALSRRKSSAVSGDERAAPPEMGRSVSCDGICAPRPSAAAAAVISRSRSDSSVEPAPGSNPSKPPLAARSRSRTTSGIELDVSDGDGRQSDDDDRRCTIRNLDNGREFVVKWNKLREVGTGQQLTMEEFEMCVGRSPIVQELMRRENVEESRNGGVGSVGGVCRAAVKKRGSWFRSIKTAVAGGGSHRERRSSDEKDTSSEKGGRRSSSATDDSQDGLNSVHHGLERRKVRHYGKSHKELSGLYMSQEIRGHKGAVWCIRFSLDGRYLASAGEDCVIHVWQVLDVERKGELVVERAVEENGSCNPFGLVIGNESPEPVLGIACIEGSHWEKKRRTKVPGGRKSVSSEQLVVPDHVFALSEKPVCSFRGHLDDVLDISWSKSEYLLSSSMDKTVRLWHLSSNSCLKTFSHSDYVTCIQFNPVDDRYFISGSLDEKVRIWSIPDRQVVDWNDLHEMVTAACYTPDGKGALVGSHKGSCHLYNTSDNKLLQKCQLDLQNKRKRSSHKKITGFQFTPGSSSEVLITSADSRIRVVDGVELVHKFRGFRNTSSQISACLTPNGKYVICASEDSHVYVWRYDANSRPSRSKGVVPVTQSYEHFYCRDVTAAVPWPSTGMVGSMQISRSTRRNGLNGVVKFDTQVPAEPNGHDIPSFPPYRCAASPQSGAVLSNPNTNTSHFGDRVSATWPEEKLLKHNHQRSDESCNGGVPVHGRSAWGMVIVTAGRGGEIRTFQNFGFPVRV